MNKTNIDYLNFSWNPLAMRCTKVSPACDHCWHIRMANRLAMNPAVEKQQRKAYSGWGEPFLCKDRLEQPLRRKKPSIIGVQFMGDLFHHEVKEVWFNMVAEIVGKCPHHTFIFLTKRPQRVRDIGWDTLYMPNVWLGVTAENQQRADERIPILLSIPAAIRFVSIEPMLGPVDISQTVTYWDDPSAGISWVIAGGETGPGARPMNISWALKVKNQCQDSGVPFFFKNWGSYYTSQTGCKLDGREWKEFPK